MNLTNEYIDTLFTCAYRGVRDDHTAKINLYELRAAALNLHAQYDTAITMLLKLVAETPIDGDDRAERLLQGITDAIIESQSATAPNAKPPITLVCPVSQQTPKLTVIKGGGTNDAA